MCSIKRNLPRRLWQFSWAIERFLGVRWLFLEDCDPLEEPRYWEWAFATADAYVFSCPFAGVLDLCSVEKASARVMSGSKYLRSPTIKLARSKWKRTPAALTAVNTGTIYLLVTCSTLVRSSLTKTPDSRSLPPFLAVMKFAFTCLSFVFTKIGRGLLDGCLLSAPLWFLRDPNLTASTISFSAISIFSTSLHICKTTFVVFSRDWSVSSTPERVRLQRAYSEPK